MNLDWMLSPLTQCVLLALGLVSCLYLVLVTIDQLHCLERKCHRYQHWTESTAQQLQARLIALENATSEIDTDRRRPSAAMRRRMLQLARRGDGPKQIASALGLPRAEVDLVLDFYGAASQPAPVAVKSVGLTNGNNGTSAHHPKSD